MTDKKPTSLPSSGRIQPHEMIQQNFILIEFFSLAGSDPEVQLGEAFDETPGFVAFSKTKSVKLAGYVGANSDGSNATTSSPALILNSMHTFSNGQYDQDRRESSDLGESTTSVDDDSQRETAESRIGFDVVDGEMRTTVSMGMPMGNQNIFQVDDFQLVIQEAGRHQ